MIAAKDEVRFVYVLGDDFDAYTLVLRGRTPSSGLAIQPSGSG
jgi:hypothetical protein